MELLRPSSLEELDGARQRLRSRGGTEVVPLLRDGIVAGRHARRRPRDRAARDRRDDDRRRHDARRARGRDARSRRRCARRAGSPRRRSSATWARSAATCSRRRAAGTGGCSFPCRLHGGDRCHARDGEHREHAIFGERLLRLGASVRRRRRAARARRDGADDDSASCRSPSSTGCPTEATADDDARSRAS